MKFFLLDKQQNIIGRLSEEYILEATFTEEINTAGELLITLPAKKRLSGNVIHVLITNPSKDHSYLMFKIIKETVKDEEVEYTAVESAYDELTSYGYIQDKRPTANAQTITEMILKDTRWHVGEIPDTSEAFISFYYLSVLDCLKKIVQTFDFEIGFDVLINDDENQITDRRVNFYIKQGEQTGKRFEYGSNLLSIKQEQDTQNIYTAIVGRGKGVQVSGGDDDNTPDGYGRRITFADVEWSKANGDPLDKPKGQEWLEDPDATKQLGFSDGHMRIGLEVFEDVDDPKVLLQKTYEALKTAERPQVQFSASVINTGELHLGDRVGITRNDIGIAYETRVFKVQHNLLDETQNKIDLGDNLEQTNNLSYQVSALQSEVTNNTEGIITVTQSANGKNKVYYSSTMPATGSNGDVWYKDLGNGETEMYIYDNGWQLVISTENLHKIEDEIKQQQTALDQAVQDANAASAKADGLVAQVGDANTNAQKALTTAQQNQADLVQAKNDLQNTKSQLSNVQTGLTSATANISQAQAELEAVKSQAAQQGQTIVNIQKSTDSLSSQIADVKGNVTALKETSNSLQATVAALNSDNLIYNSDFLASVAGKSPTDDWLPAEGWYGVNGTAVQRCMRLGHSSLQIGWISANGGFYTQPIKSNTVDPNNPDATTEYNFSCLIWTAPGVYDFYIDCSYNGDFDSPYSTKIGSMNGLDQDWTNTNWTFSVPSKYPWIRLRAISEQDKGLIALTQPMLVYGNQVPQSYISSNQPAQRITSIKFDLDGLKSVVQDNKGNISQLQQRADEISTTVTSNTGDISQLKQTANSLQTSITDNSNNISSLKQTASSLQSSIADTNNNISQLKQQSGYIQSLVAAVNSDNLITNSDCLTNAQGVSPITDWKPAWGWIYTDGNVTGRANWYGYSALQLNCISSSRFAVSQAVQAGNTSSQTTYSVSLKYMLQRTDVRHWVNIQADYDQSFSNPKFYNIGDATQVDGNHWQTLTGTVTIPAETPWVRLCIGVDGDSGYIWVAQPMLVVGDKIPDSYISSNQPAQQMTSIKQSVDSIKSMAQDNQGNISQLQQTASSLQSVVSTKADLSQVTQMGNVIQSVVQNIGPFYPDGDFSDVDLGKYYDPWDTCPNLDNFSVVTNNKDWGYYLQIYTPHGTINKAITKEYLPINAQYSLTFKGKSLLSYDGELNGSFMVFMHFFDSNKNAIQDQASYYKYDNDNVWQDFSLSFTPPSNAAYVRVETVLDNSKGDGAYWGALDNLSLDNGGSTIASKISQMSDDINLRVQKGDLLSQINIQAGSTLIQSKKLFLDASSVVFSGNAFIPSAAITDLSADKITTGTLNAGNVNIINLDVNKLVGNTTEFVRSGWTNAYGSHVQIDGGGMSITYGDWLTKFEPDGMVFRDGNEDIGGFTRIGMQNAPSWYGGLAFNAGGDAEFLAIGAKDYHNDSQNPVPAKLVWMRQGINTYGYNSGWNFCDDVWTDKIGMSEIQYQGWNIHFGEVTGSNGFSALTLTSGSGDGFYWGSDGTFGFVTGGNNLHNVRGSQIVYDINQNGGTCQTWSGVD